MQGEMQKPTSNGGEETGTESRVYHAKCFEPRLPGYSMFNTVFFPGVLLVLSVEKSRNPGYILGWFFFKSIFRRPRIPRAYKDYWNSRYLSGKGKRRRKDEVGKRGCKHPKAFPYIQQWAS